MIIITPEEYVEAVEQNLGMCLTCKDFTRECTEPDAEGYDCPECGKAAVMGAELALLANVICFAGDA